MGTSRKHLDRENERKLQRGIARTRRFNALVLEPKPLATIPAAAQATTERLDAMEAMRRPQESRSGERRDQAARTDSGNVSARVLGRSMRSP